MKIAHFVWIGQNLIEIAFMASNESLRGSSGRLRVGSTIRRFISCLCPGAEKQKMSVLIYALPLLLVRERISISFTKSCGKTGWGGGVVLWTHSPALSLILVKTDYLRLLEYIDDETRATSRSVGVYNYGAAGPLVVG